MSSVQWLGELSIVMETYLCILMQEATSRRGLWVGRPWYNDWGLLHICCFNMLLGLIRSCGDFKTAEQPFDWSAKWFSFGKSDFRNFR